MSKNSELQRDYFKTLNDYLEKPAEAQLVKVSDLGRQMVLEGLHTEDVADLHYQVLEKLSRKFPDSDRYKLAKNATVPLAELLMAYGLASRQQMVSLENAKEKIRESEQRFKIFAEAASDWFWEMGSDYCLTFITGGIKSVSGFSPEDLLGKTLPELAHPDNDRTCVNQFTENLHNQEPFRDLIIEVFTVNGPRRWVSWSGKPVCDSRGSFAGYWGSARDLTSEIEAGEAAEVSRTRLVESLESITEGFVLFDAEKKLVLCNKAYREAYPLTADLLLPGANLADILEAAFERGSIAEADALASQWVEERLARHEESESVTECCLGNGKWYRISERRTARGGVVKVLTDITERKQAEEAVRESEGKIRTLVENMSSSGAAVSVTRELAGAEPIQKHSPGEFKNLRQNYETLFDDYLNQLIVEAPKPLSPMKEIVRQIGNIGGGPRDLLDVHLEALKEKVRSANEARARAYSLEGRLLALEMMGLLVDYYRVGMHSPIKKGAST